MTDQMRQSALRRLKGPMRLTLAGLWAERLTHAFWPLWTLLIATLAALAFGIQDTLPIEGVWALLVLATLGAVWALVAGLRTFRKPSQADAYRRLDARLPGQPIAAMTDDQALGSDDPASKAVWQAHLARMADRAAQARAVEPNLRLARRDPFALRYVALTALVMAVIFGSLWRVGSVAGLGPNAAAALTTGPTWEGWAQPPAYTGKPALYLNDIDQTDLTLPRGTRLQFRLYGEVGALTLSETVSGGTTPAPAPAAAQGTAPALSKDFEVAQSGTITVDGAGGREWVITALPDAAPTVTLSGDIGREGDGRFTQSFDATDDYGVTAGQVVIALDLPAVDRRFGLAADPEARDPVTLDLPMPITWDRAKFTETLIDDLSKHPFANLPVSMTFTVSDAALQAGMADPVLVTLPGKRFFDPLAAALIEARRDILWSRSNAPAVVQVMKAVTNLPDEFIRNKRAYLRLRVALNRLDTEAKTLTTASRDELADELWEIALLVEEGDLASALERLRRAQDRLDQAIRNGADPDEVAELMDEMRRALDNYMKQLAEEAQKNPDQQTSENQPGVEMSQDQLQQMLDELQKMIDEGRMAEAAEMMEMLRQFMENMQVAQGQGQPGQGGPGQQAMKDLGETLRDQQGLSDDAFQDLQDGQPGGQGQPQPGQPQPGQPQPGQPQPGQPGEGQGQAPDNRSLAERQQDLRDRLGQLNGGQLPGAGSEQGAEGRRQLDEAGRAMREAEQALRDGDLGSALDRQAEAMEALREGMRDLGDAMAQDMQREGEAQEGDAFGQNDPNSGRDPLGREPGESARIGSDRNMLQGEDVYRRAQDLLDEIRRRSGDQQRPGVERDYLKRLLDLF